MDAAKGVVLEKNGDDIILLTPLGEFKKYKFSGPASIGDEISIPVTPNKFNIALMRNKWHYFAAAVAAVLLILLIPFAANNTLFNSQTYAFLSVDINPSIEMSLDKNLKVIEVRELNSDANQITGHLKLTGLTAKDAVAKITAEAYKEGFISSQKDNAVVMAITPMQNSFNEAAAENALDKAAKDVLAKANLGGVVQTIHATPAIRQDAINQGLSPGKYAILLEAVDSGLQITPQDLKNTSIALAIKNAGGELGEIVGKAHSDNDLAERAREYSETNKSQNSGSDNKDTDRAKGKGQNNQSSKENSKKSNRKSNYQFKNKQQQYNVYRPTPPKEPDKPDMYRNEKDD